MPTLLKRVTGFALQINGSFAPIPQLTLNGPVTLRISKGGGFNISGASGIIAGSAFNVSASSSKSSNLTFRYGYLQTSKNGHDTPVVHLQLQLVTCYAIHNLIVILL
jgi:hypothetical protein